MVNVLLSLSGASSISSSVGAPGNYDPSCATMSSLDEASVSVSNTSDLEWWVRSMEKKILRVNHLLAKIISRRW
jgi:hypothetical protein